MRPAGGRGNPIAAPPAREAPRAAQEPTGGMSAQSSVVLRTIRHYLKGAGGHRLEAFDAACTRAAELGATSTAAMLEMFWAEFMATHGGSRGQV